MNKKEEKELKKKFGWTSLIFGTVGWLTAPNWVKLLMVAYFFKLLREDE